MSGMYIRARERGEDAGSPTVTAVAVPVRTRKPMPADFPRTPPLAPRCTFRWRAGVGTEDPADESSVRLRTPRTDAHRLCGPEGIGAGASHFSIGVFTRFPHSVQEPS